MNKKKNQSDSICTDESCLLSSFQNYIDLTEVEKSLLKTLEQDATEYTRGHLLLEENSSEHRFYTVMSGWAYSSRLLTDGKRQILDIFLPGQIIGLREVGYDRSLTSVTTLSPMVACPFPKERLHTIFSEAPRLTDLFFMVMARDQHMLIERIINIGRRPAAERLAHFLLEMRARLQADTSTFELPLNQAILADTLGLTPIHVSRTIKKLREQGLVSVTNGKVTISNEHGLTRLADFSPAYLGKLTSWVRKNID